MRRGANSGELVAFWIFAVALFALPLPIGANRPWLWPLFGAVMFGLLAITSAAIAAGRWRPSAALSAARLPLILLATWLAFGLFQVLPLGIADRPLATISVEPGASLMMLLESAFLAAVFVLALQLTSTRGRIRALLGLVVLAGLIQAAYGSLMTLSGLELGAFGAKDVGRGLATGTFINRNHFAGFLEICLAIGLGALIAQLNGDAVPQSLRARFRGVVSALLGPKMRLRLALAVMVIALVLSRSRMGNTAFFASLLIAGGVALATLRRPPRSLVILLASLIAIDVLIIGTWFGVEQVVERIQETGQYDEATGRYRDEDRLDVDTETLNAWAAYRWLGSGGGTFYTVFPGARPHDIGSYFDHAHNDYLEFLLEFGVVGVVPLAAFGLTSAAAAIGAMRRRRDPLLRGCGFGALMAFLAISIHATVDFNLRIPANAAYFMLAMAFAWLGTGLPGARARSPRRPRRKSMNSG